MSSGRGRARGRAHEAKWPPFQPVGNAVPEAVELPIPPLVQTPCPPRARGRSRPILGQCPEIARHLHLAEEPQIQTLSARIEDLHPKKITSEYARRPGYGTRGKKIKLLVNYFPIDLPRGKVYHYDINIVQAIPITGRMSKTTQQKPGRLNPKITQQLFRILVSTNDVFRNHVPVFDGNKNLYTRTPLPIDNPVTFIISLEENGRQLRYVAKVKPAIKQYGVLAEIDIEALHEFIRTGEGKVPLESIQAMDIILRYGPTLRMVPVGRSFFISPTRQEVPPFGGGRELWFGHYQSLKPTEWKPVLNLDLTATPFYKRGPFLQMATELLQCRLEELGQLKSIQILKLKDFCKGLKVKVTHLQYGRKYRCVGLSKVGAGSIGFEITGDDGTTAMVTVAQYFSFRYFQLRHPTFPCLIVSGKDKTSYLPMEVCEVMEGQPCRKKLDGDLTTKVIRQTVRTPVERFQEIQSKLDSLVANSKPFLDEFGIKIQPTLASVEGRVLEPPALLYNQSTFRPTDGFWNIDRAHRFYRSQEIKSWQLLNYGRCRMDQLRNFVSMLRVVGSDLGLSIADPHDICDVSSESKLGVGEILRRLTVEQPDLELVVVVLSTVKSIYAEVKQAADTKLGLITQCVTDNTVSSKCNRQVITNICQKLNTKLGGVNNSVRLVKEELSILATPCIIFGADVTHPAPFERNFPSIAAVVANLDSHPSRFASRVRVQKSRLGTAETRVEMILELKDMVKELLVEFYKHVHLKPEKIIFYRDGVSEGQFDQVLNFEVAQIRQACTDLQADYKPPLTFIVVQKRHHTRFCPEDKRDGCGRAGNVPPGTTVDTKITHPKDHDFYLCSHYGQQGTSRPTHYTCLWDENDFTADEIQMLSYQLCHTYARCTRAISNPVPAQYAHLAAYRARAHLSACLGEDSESSRGSGSLDLMDDKQDLIVKSVNIVKEFHDKMYFI